MSFLVCLIILTSVLVLILQFIFNLCKSKSSSDLPPGPKPLPVVGNLLILGHEPHRSLAKLAQSHGPLMSLKLGQITTVEISSSTMAKEILQKHDRVFCNRRVAEAIKARQHHEHAMVWLPVAAKWRNLRKICNSYIFTAQKLDARQELRRKKVQNLILEVEESCRAGEAVDIGQAAFRTTLNLLSNTFFSMDLANTMSDTAKDFREIVCGIVEVMGKPNLADYFPMLSKIDLQGIRRRLMVLSGKLLNLIDRIVDERLRLKNEPSGSRLTDDMLDTLLKISEDKRGDFDINGIKHLFLELFVAGNDTTSTTLEWAMTELLRNPKTLSKAQQELKETIGRGNPIEESDIAGLPYLQAIVKETLRLHPPAPFLIPRKCGSDVEINGWTVPEDAQVLVNAWTIGRDPSVWENQDRFVPERFLGSDIDFRGTDFELIPFGGGRRICPGLPLAMRMLHLMLGSLVHSFDWKLEVGERPESLDMEEKFGITLQKAKSLRAVPIRFTD